jgi:hypothetical protein
VIGVATGMLCLQAHSLRYYERIGIIKLYGGTGIGAEEIREGE